ncbi:hypothetical protein N7449_004389 [Penicillium cf. viridicatum]|uniref:Catalase core domain-containing protein n=1 Tax=Penicillium cf. viridicatum TaxID=2972119 RepID=A0A9W9SYA4_9EURO|nr:hypothetical protein N7449_004389 [Penicillium cf. viridicatum]
MIQDRQGGGLGSYSEFEATRDCSDFTYASFLNKVGKKTPVLQRVSTVGTESGSADTSHDVHGWSMKLYTDEGNLDWVFNNTICSVVILIKFLTDCNSHSHISLSFSFVTRSSSRR